MSEEELKNVLRQMKDKGVSERHRQSIYNAFYGDVKESGSQRGVSTNEYDRRMKELERNPGKLGVERRHVKMFQELAEPEMDEGVKRG